MKLRIGQKLIFSISLLFISNILTSISLNDKCYMYFIYSAVFAFISVFLFLFKKDIPKTAISITLLVFSIPTLLDNNISNLTGFFIFLMAFWLSPKSKKIYIFYLIIYAVFTIYKFNITKSLPSQIIGYLGGVSIFGVIYQHYIHQHRIVKYEVDYQNIEINNSIKDIAELLILGYSWNEISLELNLSVTGKTVQRTFDNYWKDKKFNNREQFVHFLGQKGTIKQIDKNVITE